MTEINKRAEKCGYNKFLDEALTFPPPKDFPTIPGQDGDCDLWEDIVKAATYINPCFNM